MDTEKEVKFEDFKANFRSIKGKPFLVYCPKCKKENYLSAVATGKCNWCGWKAEGAE
jgi:hypothetical protein